MIGKLWPLVLLLLATPAQAEWREIRTPHFLVYGDSSEARLRAFAEKLEKFNFVLRTYHIVPEPAAQSRFRVFLLPSVEAVGRMAGGSGIAGFYVAEARAQMFVGVHGLVSDRTIDPETILLHEYTHHFMYQYFPAAYPAWYSEGFAEFWSTTRILPNNVVEVGLPAEHRFQSFNPNLGFIRLTRWLPVQQLLAAENYRDVPEVDLLYAEGWLLVRYIFDNRDRRQQLQAYLNMINGGTPYAEAATRAFGDLGRLNSELFSYAGRTRFQVLQLPFRQLPVGALTARVLRPAEQALIAYEIRLSRGIPQREIADFAGELRARATPYPDDPFALGLLTEAERLAGNRDAARAAADRWVRADPQSGRALMNQALLGMQALQTENRGDAAGWEAMRRQIARANQLTPNDALILRAYYDSYLAQGVTPPEAAQSALYTAMELAPNDEELRYRVALDFEQRNMIKEAIAIIRPVAYRQMRANETDRQRRRREAWQEHYREAGLERRETAGDMLERLQQKLAEAAPAPAPN